jgi:elongation factor G
MRCAKVLEQGVYAGYPFADVQVTLVDGRFHSVATCGMDFRIAGSKAVRQAARKAQPTLIEPVMRLDIDIDEDHFGAVTADLGRRRGRISAVEVRKRGRHLVAEAPLSAMRGYASDLRSLTQGHCAFVVEFQRYELVPEERAAEIASQRRLEGKIRER